MRSFGYDRAVGLDRALSTLSETGATVLAGGTELLNWLRLGVAAPELVLDITRIPDLDAIAGLPGGGLQIGALATLNQVGEHEAVVRGYPALSQAALKAASAQLRNLATIGGNLLQKTRCAYFRSEEPTPCNKRKPGSGCAALHGQNDRHALFGWSESCVAVHPSDPAVALAALDAVVVARSARGERRIPLVDLHTLPGDSPWRETVLDPDELITAIVLPAPAPRSAYVKVRERESYEFALVSAAAALELDGRTIRRARLALGSVALRPWRLPAAERRLVGMPIGSADLSDALDADLAGARPLSHNAFKVALARNAMRRAIELAAEGGR
jgi:xanthine dehydrogenase YagS FAD-binding subunit